MDSCDDSKPFTTLPGIPNSVLIKHLIKERKKNERIPFSKEEDARLIKLVEIYGNKEWQLISNKMSEDIGINMKLRTSRQCKERYESYLSPTLNNNNFTPEEDSLLVEKFMEMGPKWEKISSFFKGRCANKLKNRWNTYLKKKANKEEQIKNDIKVKSEETCGEICFFGFNNYDQFYDNDQLADDYFYVYDE